MTTYNYGKLTEERSSAEHSLYMARRALEGLSSVREVLQPKVPLLGRRLNLRDKSDIEWIAAILNNYVRQYELGLCCLLDHKIDGVRATLDGLNEKLNNWEQNYDY